MGLLRHFYEKNILKKYKVVTFYYLLTNSSHHALGKVPRKSYHKSDELIPISQCLDIASVGDGYGPCHGKAYSETAAFSASGGVRSVEPVK